MKAGWAEQTLPEVCQIKPPKSIVRKQLSDNELVSFVPMNNLGEVKKSFQPLEDRALLDVVKGYTYFANGDVLVAKITPCFENGKMGLAQDLRNGVGFDSSEFVVLRSQGKIDPEFLFYYLSRNEFRTAGARVMSGAVGHKRVPKEYFEDLKVPLPPLEEQKRIVAVLDEAFAALDRARTHAETNLNNARELFESYLASIFSDQASDWALMSFGDSSFIKIVDGDRGPNYPKKADFLSEGHCLFLNTKNVRPDGFNFDTKMFITEEKDKALRKGKIERRDVVLTTRGTIGNIALYDDTVEYEDIRINSGMLVLRPNEEIITSEYLFELLRSHIVKAQIDDLVSGAAQPQLPIKSLVKFEVPVPSLLTDQTEIVGKLSDLSEKCASLTKSFTTKLSGLEGLRQSLLQKAFTGELT